MNPAENSMNPAGELRCCVDPRLAKREHFAVSALFRQRIPRNLTFLQVNFLAWCGVAFVLFWVRLGIYESVGRALVITFSADTLGFFLTCGLREFYRRQPTPLPLRLGTILQVAALSLLGAVAQAGGAQALAEFMNWHEAGRSFANRLTQYSAGHWILYLAWSFGYFWLKAARQARLKSQQSALAKAAARRWKLQMLRFQLDPHFLFNTLNSIASEIPCNPASATRMVGELSSYLRHSLDRRSELITSLDEELDATKAYLNIQKARFGDKLQASITATPATRQILVPSFLLQPLVENAFKHGFDQVPPPWSLHVGAEVEEGRLKIEVRNTNQPANHGPGDKSGLGLGLIRRRLQLHYPGRHRFHLQQAEGWTVATVELEGLPCFV
jgi:hypothetical protein